MINEATPSITVKHLSSKTLYDIPLPSPKLCEQKLIVGRLDDLIRITKSASQDLHKIPSLIQKYRTAILREALSGNLTKDWRIKSGVDSASRLYEYYGVNPIENLKGWRLPKGWFWVSAGSLCEIKGGITLGKNILLRQKWLNGPTYGWQNVQRGWIDLKEIKVIKVKVSESETLKLLPGDILMNEGGDRDKLGRGWVWEGQIANCIHQKSCFFVFAFVRR